MDKFDKQVDRLAEWLCTFVCRRINDRAGKALRVWYRALGIAWDYHGDLYDRQMRGLLEAEFFDQAVAFQWSRGIGFFAHAFSVPHDAHHRVAMLAACDCFFNPGCLTQIRLEPARFAAETQLLHDTIAADERIPTCCYDIRPRHLPTFVEYRRLIDAMRDNGQLVVERREQDLYMTITT